MEKEPVESVTREVASRCAPAEPLPVVPAV